MVDLKRAATSASLRLVSILLALACQACQPTGFAASNRLDPVLRQVEQRLDEETRVDAPEPNSPAYLRAIGSRPVRSVAPPEMMEARTLSLEECLQLAFENSSDIKQAREQMLLVGGSRLIANSRFLPTIELVGQFEHISAFEAADPSLDASVVSATLVQRLLEWGKDNPIDIQLREDQRQALFNYERSVAEVFSEVRRAFFFIRLKQQQIAARQELLAQFEAQARVKEQRMEAGNLSVRIEVLTAQLNVLNEKTRINTLERQRFNRKAELLRLIGLPVGANQVEFIGAADSFGLKEFDMDAMVRLALAQSSELAFVETLVAEEGRALDQLRYEYYPDLRFTGGYQDEYGRTAVALRNDDDTWGLDVIGQPGVPGSDARDVEGLGLFGPDVSLDGPDPGWFAGVQLRIPVAEGRARTGRRIQARARLNAALAQAEDQEDVVELSVRQGYTFLQEQQFEVDLARETVNIEQARFQIQEELRDAGKVTNEDLETFRTAFFTAQDRLFLEQETLIERQEDLRLAIRYFK